MMAPQLRCTGCLIAAVKAQWTNTHMHTHAHTHTAAPPPLTASYPKLGPVWPCPHAHLPQTRSKEAARPEIKCWVGAGAGERVRLGTDSHH